MQIPIGPCPSVEESKNSQLFTFAGVKGEGICTYIYDIDSFNITMMLFDTPLTLKTRLMGVDGVELRNTNLKEKTLAYKGKSRLGELILDKTINVELHGGDKYGRELVKVTLGDGQDLANVLISEKLVAKYDGGTKQNWADFMETWWPDIQPYDN